MPKRAWLLLLLAAVTAAALLQLRPEPPAIVRIELARGRDQLVLQRRRDTGAWVIASAEDAPGDSARIAALIASLRALERGGPAAAVPAGEPLELRLTTEDDRTAAHHALWPGVARRLPGGAPFATSLALPTLAPSAWSTLAPPVIDPATLVEARAIRPGAAILLDAAERAALAADLGALAAAGWVPARQLDWTTASYVQARRRDGSVVELQRLALADGRRFARLTSDRDPALRAVRHFAFPIRRAAPAEGG